MFTVEIKNISIPVNIGITSKERAKKQILKVTLSFSYIVNKKKDLDKISNVKDYSKITKYLKKIITDSRFNTLEKLIDSTTKKLKKEFKLKNIKIKINKTAVAKKYGSESLNVSN